MTRKKTHPPTRLSFAQIVEANKSNQLPPRIVAVSPLSKTAGGRELLCKRLRQAGVPDKVVMELGFATAVNSTPPNVAGLRKQQGIKQGGPKWQANSDPVDDGVKPLPSLGETVEERQSIDL